MKWLLPPVAPGSAPAPGPGPGDLDPRRRRELFRVFTMVRPAGRVQARPPRPGSRGRRPAGREAGPGEPGRETSPPGRRGAQARTGDRRARDAKSTWEGKWRAAGAAIQAVGSALRRLRPPQQEPSGAAMSAPFSPVLALELRASGLRRRRADETASGRDRCGALQGRAALPSPAALRWPRPSGRPRPAV